MTETKGFRPPPPKWKRSTKTALAVIGGIMLAGLAVPRAPPPSGWVLIAVVVYLGLPLVVMVINDLSELRQSRILFRNLDVYPPTEEDPVQWFDVKYEPLAAEHIARWRRWFPWLLGILAAMALAAVAGLPAFVFIGLLIVGFGRELFLAVNVLEWLVPANWMGLSAAERLRLRLCLLVSALATGVISLGIVGVVYYLFFVSDERLSWRQFAFAAVYGMVVWPCGRAFVRFARKAFRRVPPDERPAERPV